MTKYTRYDIIKPIFGHPFSTLNDIPRSLETTSYNAAIKPYLCSNRFLHASRREPLWVIDANEGSTN